MTQLKSTNPKDRIGITKVPLHLIPLTAQINQALAHLDGACKYGPYNWRDENVAASVYVAACLRHLQKWLNGREVDRDSGVHELGHATACLNIIMDAQASGKLVDDRPTPDKSPEQLDKAAEDVVRLLKRHGVYREPTPTLAKEQR